MITSDKELLEAAVAYRQAGLCVLPALCAEKRPAIGSWKGFQFRLPGENQLSKWFSGDCDAICLVTGSVSGNLEMIDFDGQAELFVDWCERVSGDLLGVLVVEESQSGGKHVIYRCEGAVPGNAKLASRSGRTLIETRGQGGLFLCAPTPGYTVTQGSIAGVPVIGLSDRKILIGAARSLDEPVSNGRPGDEFNANENIASLLKKHGWRASGIHADGNQHWTRPGKPRGTSATLKNRVFYVFSSNAQPFEPNRGYSPFAVLAQLEHGGDYHAAARSLNGDVDLSGILSQFNSDSSSVSDPGPIPENLLRVPGFVERVMDFTLSAAPYPNLALAFCGAMALQSFLAGRKVCTAGDLRTNLYLLALASSGTGKEFPRKVNSNILYQIGLAGALGDKFASGEGIQDALLRTGAMLFQNDEMDGVLRQINLDLDNRRESIPNILLTLYTSANNIYPLRVKAGQKELLHIDQPHLTLFGTATPQFFYESLSQRMLTNGFFARMCIVDIGKRGAGQTPGSARNLPEDVLETARWWSEYQPGSGNLQAFHPTPREVPFEREAAEAVEQLRIMTESEYDRAEETKDEVARTAWSRTCENAKKLALIYACSENHQAPRITLSAVRWATVFAMHQTRRQLHLATTYVAENPFHGECLKLLRHLQERGGQMSRSELLRRMRCKSSDFDQIVCTLTQQGEIVPVSISTKTKPAQGYRIA